MKTSRSLSLAALATTVVSSLGASIPPSVSANPLEGNETTIVQTLMASEPGNSSDRSPMPGDSRR
ncbi:MAG: hypothetical protein WBB29_02945 [Geitlerinemataceae cyanobacterium]